MKILAYLFVPEVREMREQLVKRTQALEVLARKYRDRTNQLRWLQQELRTERRRREVAESMIDAAFDIARTTGIE